MHSESKRYDFERLYIDCQPRLTAYALRFVNNPIEAQDLVHDCFMALWDRQAPLDPEEARMLLFAMTRNRCLNYLKHKSIVDKYTISCLARAKIGEERLYNYDFSFAENGHPYLMLFCFGRFPPLFGGETEANIIKKVKKCRRRSENICGMGRVSTPVRATCKARRR